MSGGFALTPDAIELRVTLHAMYHHGSMDMVMDMVDRTRQPSLQTNSVERSTPPRRYVGIAWNIGDFYVLTCSWPSSRPALVLV